MMDDGIVNLAERAAALAVVRPGDTLVLVLNRSMSMEEVDDLRTQWEDRVPDTKIVLIENVDGLTVVRPERRPTGYRVKVHETSAPVTLKPHQVEALYEE